MILFYHFIVFLETGYLFVCKSIIFHISVLCFSNLYFNHRIYVSWILMFALYVSYVMYVHMFTYVPLVYYLCICLVCIYIWLRWIYYVRDSLLIFASGNFE